jgi:ribonuclease HII
VTRYSLDELRQRYVIKGRPLEAGLEEILRADTRAGARAILASIEKRRFENRSEGQRLRKMLRFETLLWDEGQDAVAGVDEAGMSPLAGPVSAAAVILKPGTRITGIDDSKKLDANSREALAKEIKEKAASWSVAFVEVEEIDTINIYWAGILAMRRAVEGLGVVPQHLLIDAKRLKEIAIPQQAIIKGDAKSASIAAASILAKVSRDALMRTLDTRHPGYGFADHKGYPVRAHYSALAQLGACPAHRRPFGPVREVLGFAPATALALGIGSRQRQGLRHKAGSWRFHGNAASDPEFSSPFLFFLCASSIGAFRAFFEAISALSQIVSRLALVFRFVLSSFLAQAFSGPFPRF